MSRKVERVMNERDVGSDEVYTVYILADYECKYTVPNTLYFIMKFANEKKSVYLSRSLSL